MRTDVYIRMATVATLVGWQVNKVNSPKSLIGPHFNVSPKIIGKGYRIACIYMLFLVLSCEGGYKTKRPARCYYSRLQCEAKCCCTGKRCEPTTGSGRPYYKCVTVDCGSLSDPANGNVVMLGGTTFESLAEYRCKDGYKLSYPAGRTCLSSGLWSGMAPRCEPEPDCALEECTKLEPPCNGLLVDAPMNPKPGDVVTYDCQEGFKLEGEKNRTCQDDYTWDGNSPCCIKTCRQMSEYGISFEGSTYRLFRNPQRSWADAKSVCEADGAHLVEIKSAAENYHLETLIGSTNLWTNGNKIDNDGIWIWPIDGSNFYPVSPDVYSFWAPGTVGGYRLHCICFQCFRSPCDFFWRQMGTKSTETLCRSYGDHTVIVYLAHLHTEISQFLAEVAQSQYAVCMITM